MRKILLTITLLLSLGGHHLATAQDRPGASRPTHEPLNPGQDTAGIFKSPPPEFRSLGWFFWNGGHISRDGLTKDLEDMHTSGIGGGIVMHVASLTGGDPVPFYSKQWQELMAHMFQEGQRLGLQFGVHNCPGYSSSGGPWVPVEQAMKELVWTETLVDGPGKVTVQLPKPAVTLDFYREVAVLAYPEQSRGGNLLRRHRETVRLSTGDRALDLGRLLDGADGPAEKISTADGLEIRFAEPVTVGAVRWKGRGGAKDAAVTFSAVNDNGVATELGRMVFKPHELVAKTANFPLVTGRVFRFSFDEPYREQKESNLAEVGLFSGPLVLDPDWKTHQRSRVSATDPEWLKQHELAAKGAEPATLPPGAPAPPEASAIIDLTALMRPDGTLEWDAPEGTWTVMRFGMTAQNKSPHPSPRIDAFPGKSLEVDKLDADAMRGHLNVYGGQLLQDAGEAAGTSFRFLEIDSYEQGFQSWTAAMPEKFRQRNGYEMGPWLVALAGRPVNSLAETDRFLWDFRRTVVGLFADEYFGTLREFAQKHGLLAYAEAYGPQVFDTSQCSGRMDAPMAEVWWREPPEGENRKMSGGASYVPGAHAANTYGREIVACEAFSTNPGDAGWRNHPRNMKPLADGMFRTGINQIMFHAYSHQAYDLAPGQTMAVWGSQFGRHNSWWPLSRGWHDYLARCQFLLRQGVNRSDFARHLGEEIPEPPWLPSITPAGYRSDDINTEVIVRDLAVRDGKLVLPHGAKYEFLLIDTAEMRPELARKVEELVKAGGTLVGPKPARSKGLHRWREADAEVAAIGERVWGDCDGKNITEHRYGEGRVIWGKQADAVLRDLGVKPDVEFKPESLGWIHRATDEMDVYFLTNGSEPLTTECTFRVQGRLPELWCPLTGAIARPRAFSHTEDGRTKVTLDLPADGSVFVVFRKDGPSDLPVALDPAQMRTTQTIEGPWEVSFQPGRGAPEKVRFEKLASLSEHSDPGIKYFSGVATYRTSFTLPGAPEGRLFIDLGNVAEVARVRVNGQMAGDVWAMPLQAEITSLAKPGVNSLEIDVANRWINRLIGDEQFPDDVEWVRAPHFGSTGYALAKLPDWFPDPSKRGEPRRIAFPFFKHYTKDSRLVPAGLLGPVRLQTIPVAGVASGTGGASPAIAQ